MLESKKVRAVLWILGGLIVVFLAFGLGVAVGYGRAGFATGFDRNYFRIFYGASTGISTGGMATGVIMPTPPVAIHGVVGTIIDLGTSTITVDDQQGNEQSIVVSSGTIIRSGNNTIAIGSLGTGDHIAVIGDPTGGGQINARFIRIFTAPSL